MAEIRESAKDRRKRFLRTDANGRLVRPPLANPYAIVVPWVLPEKQAKARIEQLLERQQEIEQPQSGRLNPSQRSELRKIKSELETLQVPIRIDELAKELSDIDPSQLATDVGNVNAPTRAAQIRLELEKLLARFDKRDATFYGVDHRPRNEKLYSETTYLEMVWRKGISLDVSDLDETDSHAFREGRKHFAHKNGGGKWAETISGNTLAMSLRDQLRTYAMQSGYQFELLGFSGVSQYKVKITDGDSSLRILIAPYSRQPKSKDKVQELKDSVDLVLTTNHSWEDLPCLILRGQSVMAIDAQQYAREVQRGNLGFGQATGVFEATSAHKRGGVVFKEDQGKRPLVETIEGLLKKNLVIVDGVDGIGNDLFPTERKAAIVPRESEDLVKQLIKKDAYLANRKQLLREFAENNIGFTAVLDGQNGAESRFGLGAYLYPTYDKPQYEGLEWSAQIGGPKVVINPSSWFLTSANINGKTGKEFKPEDWTDTTVVFYCTDINRARREKQNFEGWIDRYRKEVDPDFDADSIGLVLESPTQQLSVGIRKISAALKEPKLDFAGAGRVEEGQPWDLERNFLRFEGGLHHLD